MPAPTTPTFLTPANAVVWTRIGTASFAESTITSTYGLPTWVGFSFTGVSGSPNAVPATTGFESGDLMVLVSESAQGDDLTVVGSGWTQVASSPQQTDVATTDNATRVMAWTKTATSSAETAPELSDQNNHIAATLFAIRPPVGGTLTINTHAGNNTGTTDPGGTAISIPGDTTTAANCLILAIVGHGIDSTSAQVSAWANADLANLTERIDQGTTWGTGGGIAVATGEKAAAGVFAATTATLASTMGQGRIMLAITAN